jgi:uncharacterized protein (TIGR02145 family)
MPPKHLAFAILFFAFTAHSGDNTITYGGKTYKTVKIGEQTWMAENLNYEAKGSICYENNPANCAKYGRLYDWKTAMKVCPKGWHLPTDKEWDKLLRFVDGNTDVETGYISRTAGEFLKATSGWNEDGNGTNDYGFSALPGGYGFSDGRSYGVGGVGYWWSTKEYSARGAYYRFMFYDGNYVSGSNNFKSVLYSVRCVQD